MARIIGRMAAIESSIKLLGRRGSAKGCSLFGLLGTRELLPSFGRYRMIINQC
jgi:hypothetical protein